MVDMYARVNFDVKTVGWSKALDIIINGVDLYVHNCNYVKFEVDK